MSVVAKKSHSAAAVTGKFASRFETGCFRIRLLGSVAEDSLQQSLQLLTEPLNRADSAVPAGTWVSF